MPDIIDNIEADSLAAMGYKDPANADFFVDLTVPVKFPPKVNNYLNAQGFEAQQKVYMAAQRMTFAEAGL